MNPVAVCGKRVRGCLIHRLPSVGVDDCVSPAGRIVVNPIVAVGTGFPVWESEIENARPSTPSLITAVGGVVNA